MLDEWWSKDIREYGEKKGSNIDGAVRRARERSTDNGELGNRTTCMHGDDFISLRASLAFKSSYAGGKRIGDERPSSDSYSNGEYVVFLVIKS
jgi:hypothetical protein